MATTYSVTSFCVCCCPMPLFDDAICSNVFTNNNCYLLMQVEAFSTLKRLCVQRDTPMKFTNMYSRVEHISGCVLGHFGACAMGTTGSISTLLHSSSLFAAQPGGREWAPLPMNLQKKEERFSTPIRRASLRKKVVNSMYAEVVKVPRCILQMAQCLMFRKRLLRL